MTRSRAPRPRPPKLDPEIAADDQLLATAVDAVLLAEPDLRAMSRKIVRLQGKLRILVSDEAWHGYLDVEAASNARLAGATVKIARWAFEQGRSYAAVASHPPEAEGREQRRRDRHRRGSR